MRGHPIKGKKYPKMGDAHKGHIPWNKGTKGIMKAWNKDKKLGKGFYPKRNYSNLEKYQFQKGEKHWNWKGGITPRNHHTEDKRYIGWRTGVFARDSFTCVICHIVGGYLEAHHIKSWSKHPKCRYEIWNGITLCENCHINANNIQRYLERKGGTVKALEELLAKIKKVNNL